MARGRPRLYPADVARDGAPIFTLRMPPELLAFVREQGGGAFVRGLIEAEQRRQLSCVPAEALEEGPEAAKPVFCAGGPWAVCPAPARERQRLQRAPGELWALVHVPSRRLVGLLPGSAEQARHLALVTQARFPQLAREEQLEESDWVAYVARLGELGLLVAAQGQRLAPLQTTPAAAAESVGELQWIHQGWGVGRLPELERVLMDLEPERAWAIGHVPSRRFWGVFVGRFEAAVRLAQSLADRFGPVDQLSWEQFLRRRGLVAELRRRVAQGQLRRSPLDEKSARRSR